MNTMNKQRGSVIGWALMGLFGLIFVSGLIFTVMVISKRNAFVRIENNIHMAYEESKTFTPTMCFVFKKWLRFQRWQPSN